MNIEKAIQHLYPNAQPVQDFIVQDDSDGNGPYIAQWNLTDPKPTENELSAAWEIIKDRPPAKTDDQREIDQLRTQLSNQNDANTVFMEFVLSTLGV